MNTLQTMDNLQHAEGCAVYLVRGGVCDCGLDEVRAAVRELVEAADKAQGWCEHDSNSEWLYRVNRLQRALAPFFEDA